VFGSELKAKAFAKEDRRQHRSDQRELSREGKLKPSEGSFATVA
jgi:hypothetical protein